MKYTILETFRLEQLIDVTNMLLGLGWEPLGGPQSDGKGYFQAMIKRSKHD